MSINKAIEDAIDKKSSIKVIYHGGSMKGQLRDITPLSIKGDNIRARCHNSNAVKTFKATKIEVMDQDGVIIEAENISKSDKVTLSTLKELFEFIQSDPDFSPWHVEFEDESISLHRKFKNGKALKPPLAG